MQFVGAGAGVMPAEADLIGSSPDNVFTTGTFDQLLDDTSNPLWDTVAQIPGSRFL